MRQEDETPRYRDLVERGLFNSRMTLWRSIERENFPRGILITPNARCWTEDEVHQWIACRPTGKKLRHAAPRAAEVRGDNSCVARQPS